MPLLDLVLIRDRNVMSSMLIGLFAGMILSGSLFVLPEFLRNISAQPIARRRLARSSACMR